MTVIKKKTEYMSVCVNKNNWLVLIRFKQLFPLYMATAHKHLYKCKEKGLQSNPSDNDKMKAVIIIKLSQKNQGLFKNKFFKIENYHYNN
jgi:hypothetical protein